MKIPEFSGAPLSMLLEVTMPESDVVLWQYGLTSNHMPNTPESIDQLIRNGYELVPRDPGNFLLSHLFSRLSEVQILEPGRAYVPSRDLAHARKYPVTLAFPLGIEKPAREEEEENGNPKGLYMLQILPPPRIGENGLVNHNGKLVPYHISQLSKQAIELWEKLSAAIEELAAPGDWIRLSEVHPLCVSELNYQRMITDIRSAGLRGTKDIREQARQSIANLEVAHKQVLDMRDSWLKSDWLLKWKDIRDMVNELAESYYKHHKTQTKKSTLALPPLTSSHQTQFPSIEHLRGLSQSFGPAVARSLWDMEEHAKEQLLRTPNGAYLAVRGENDHEQVALHQFIDGGMGVEGIKYMVVMLAAYFEQTGAADRKIDARLTLRQLLTFMGRGEHADDLDEQRKLMHYILYLSRTWITALDRIYDQSPRRGRPRQGYLEYSPLVVLEALGSDVRGGIRIPDVIEFHLGKEYWDQMFGMRKHFFTIPTQLILNYHSKDQSHEICLAFYLANMLNLNFGRFEVHFPTLLIQTGLQDQQDIANDAHRTRNALRVLYALEQLEKDLLIAREPHVQVDTALAVEHYTGRAIKTINGKAVSSLAESTLERIHTAYRHFKALPQTELQTRRREALQGLLTQIKHNSLKIKNGPIINTQISTRKQQQTAAIEKHKQAQEAARKRAEKRNKRA